MAKKTRWLACFLAFVLLLLPVSTAFGATSNVNTGFTIWPSKTTTEVNKVWTITFNAPLLGTSVNSNTVYVTNSKQTKVATTTVLSSDGLSVTVTPSTAYAAGDYNLYITNGLASLDSLQLSTMIIVPFTVIASSSTVIIPPTISTTTITSYVSVIVTVTDDFKAVYSSDLSGALYLEGKTGNRIGPVSKDLLTGKYTFNIYADDDYSLQLLSISNGVINTRSIHLGTIKMPIIKLPSNGSITPTIKSTSIVISDKAGVDGGKAGGIGGSIIPEKWGVPVKVSNTTMTWTTTTDGNGNFRVYLPTGIYQLDIGENDVQYKKHRYKLTVTAGQMASPVDTVNVEEPINKLGLNLTQPVTDAGSGILSGIDVTTKEIQGTVNNDATIYIYDTAPSTPVLITTAKPDKTQNFIAKLPSTLKGKKLQLKVIDTAENTYILDMASPI